jgi:hypothetical protein
MGVWIIDHIKAPGTVLFVNVRFQVFAFFRRVAVEKKGLPSHIHVDLGNLAGRLQIAEANKAEWSDYV